MPVPKRKRSRSRRDKRFATKGIKLQALTKCNNCQQALMPHTVCKSCGFYKGIKILYTKSERSEKRMELKKARASRAQATTPASE